MVTVVPNTVMPKAHHAMAVERLRCFSSSSTLRLPVFAFSACREIAKRIALRAFSFI